MTFGFIVLGEFERGKIKEKTGNVWWVVENIVILHDFCAIHTLGETSQLSELKSQKHKLWQRTKNNK